MLSCLNWLVPMAATVIMMAEAACHISRQLFTMAPLCTGTKENCEPKKSCHFINNSISNKIFAIMQATIALLLKIRALGGHRKNVGGRSKSVSGQSKSMGGRSKSPRVRIPLKLTLYLVQVCTQNPVSLSYWLQAISIVQLSVDYSYS